MGVHGLARAAQARGDLVLGAALDVAQEHGVALRAGEGGHRGVDARGGVGERAVLLILGFRGGRGGLAGGGHPRAALMVVAAGLGPARLQRGAVGGHVQPPCQRPTAQGAREHGCLAHQGEEGGLGRVLGGMGFAEHALADAEDQRGVALDQGLEGVLRPLRNVPP